MRGGRRVLTLQSNWLNPLPVLLPFLVPVGVVALVDGFFWLAVIWRRLFCTFSSSEMNVFFNSFSYSSSSRRANSAINVSEWCWTRHSSSESSSFSWPTLHVSNSIIKGGYYIPHIKEIILYILTLLMDGARQSVGHGALGRVGALMHVLAHIRRWRILQHPEPDEYIFPALNNRRVEKKPTCIRSSISLMTSSADWSGSISKSGGFCATINACKSRSDATASSSSDNVSTSWLGFYNCKKKKITRANLIGKNSIGTCLSCSCRVGKWSRRAIDFDQSIGRMFP